MSHLDPPQPSASEQRGPTWELDGLDWKAGSHHGTLVGARGLELVPGVSRGSYERALPPGRGLFRRLVASLNPEPFPVGAALRLSVRAERERGPSRWCSLGILGSGRAFPASESSSAAEGEPHVEVDEWLSAEPVEVVRIRLELEAGELGGSPQLRRLALETDAPGAPTPERREAWGILLEVPQRSQRVLGGDLPERACSPTSLAMVLAYHGQPLEPEEVARRVYDHGAQLYGNWSLNVALAGELGLRATVRRPTSLGFVEAEVLAGRPVVVSHRFGPGELPASPLPQTKGHLIVVVGLTAAGDPIVHDPAADPRLGQEIQRVYPREAFARSWLGGAGVAYQVRLP